MVGSTNPSVAAAIVVLANLLLSLAILGTVVTGNNDATRDPQETSVDDKIDPKNLVVDLKNQYDSPFPSKLVTQERPAVDDDKYSIQLGGVYYPTPKRYIIKKAHLSREDIRVYDADDGQLVYVSHHYGKNPLGGLDPLDIANTDGWFHFGLGEWESMCTVSSPLGNGGSDADDDDDGQSFPKLHIRPKKLTRHGRQYVKTAADNTIIMNIGRMSKAKALSFRPQFTVGRGSDSKDVVYKCRGDVVGKKIQIFNRKGHLVAQMTKTTMSVIQSAAGLGSGVESYIDVAAGVDCSAILAVVYALGQVGKHYIRDAISSFVKEPIKDHVVDEAINCVTGEEGVCTNLGDNLDVVAETASGEIGEFAGDVGEFAEEIGEFFDVAADGMEGFVDGAADIISDSVQDNLGEIVDFFASFF